VILYLGASSLVKLYSEEIFSALVREWVAQAEMVVTSRVVYAEIIHALHKRATKGDLSDKDYETISNAFAEDWRSFVTIDFDELETGRLIKKYGLRRIEAINLSAALLLKKERDDISLSFSSADANLCKAAAAEGLTVMTFPSPGSNKKCVKEIVEIPCPSTHY
jgi:predicted nucleic acid-binding protein